MSTKDKIEISWMDDALFEKCYICKMFSFCNFCSINRYYTVDKEKQCN